MSAISISYASSNVTNPEDQHGFSWYAMFAGIGAFLIGFWQVVKATGVLATTAINRLNHQEKRIGEYEVKQVEQEQKQAALELALVTKEKNITALRAEIAELRRTTDAETGKLRDKDEEQEKRIESLEKQLAEAEREKRRLEIELAAAKDELLRKEMQIASLEREKIAATTQAKIVESTSAIAKVEKVEEKVDRLIQHEVAGDLMNSNLAQEVAKRGV